MRKFFLSYACLWLALVLAIGAARAEDVTFPELADTVPGGAKATYLDLVREIVADGAIGPDGILTGSQIRKLRHLSGDETIAPPSRAVLDTGISAQALADGKRLMLLFELGRPEGDTAAYAVLALYDLSATPRLLDAVNIGYAVSNFFLTPAIMPLGDGDLIQSLSLHFNSSQAYQTTALTLLRDNRFELIDDVFTFDDKHCGFERAQRISIAAVPSDTPMADIDVSVVEIVTHTSGDCEGEKPAAGERTIGVVYRWDTTSMRYAPDSDAFEVLARENEQRF